MHRVSIGSPPVNRCLPSPPRLRLEIAPQRPRTLPPAGVKDLHPPHPPLRLWLLRAPPGLPHRPARIPLPPHRRPLPVVDRRVPAVGLGLHVVPPHVLLPL